MVTAILSFLPEDLGRQLPTTSCPSRTPPGRPRVRQRSLRAAPSGTTSSRSRPWRNRSNGPSRRTRAGFGGRCQRLGVFGEHLEPLTVHVDRHDVVGPAGGDLPDRGVDVAGHQLRVGGTEEAQDSPDRVEVRRHRGGAGPSRDAAQHRRRGAGLELEARLEGRETERLLVGVDGVAGPAVAEVGLVQPGGQLGGTSRPSPQAHGRCRASRRRRPRAPRGPGCPRP